MRHDSCVHSTGVLNPRAPECKMGINYRQLVGGEDAGWATRAPCTTMEPRNGEKVSCPHLRMPTAEEIAEDKRQSDERMKRFMAAYSGKVREWRQAQNWSKSNRVAASGKVPCEACNAGEIHLTMSAYNGHVWGKCTTEGCVEWME